MSIGEWWRRYGAVVLGCASLWIAGCTRSGSPPAASSEEASGIAAEVGRDETRSLADRDRRPFVASDRPEQTSPDQEFRIFDQVHLGPWTVTMEKTSLSEVRDMVGSGQIAYFDRDSHPLWRLCLVAHDQVDTVFVVFESGIMGGPELAIIGVHIGMGAPRYDVRCSEIPIAPDAISIQGTLKLGMRRRDVMDQLGAPVAPPEPARPELEEYAPLDENTDYFERGTVVDEPAESGLGSYDVTNSALARFHHGRLVELAVWKVSTI